MNKIAHGIVLVFFGTACWFVWALLQLPRMVVGRGGERQLPAFTRFCMGLGSWIVIGPTILAMAYCFWVWFGKKDGGKSWVAFLATATAALLFVTLPTIVAIYLPLVDALHHLKVQ